MGRPRRGDDGRWSWRCRLLGCTWERRKAYDYCHGCGAARWHIAMATAPSAPSPAWLQIGTLAAPWSSLRTSLLGVLGLIDCEGSELFVDLDEVASTS